MAELSEFGVDTLGRPCRKLYLVLQGSKSEYKHAILNECLSLCARKWFNLIKARRKVNPVIEPIEPGSFETLMKRVFSVLHDYKIEYKYAYDFNRHKQFHAILKNVWKEGKQVVMLCFFYFNLVYLLCLSKKQGQ